LILVLELKNGNCVVPNNKINKRRGSVPNLKENTDEMGWNNIFKSLK
jgi:hypothetical protein